MGHRNNLMITYEFGQDLVSFEMQQHYSWDVKDVKPLEYMQDISINDAYKGLDAIIKLERTLIDANCLPETCPYCDGSKYYILHENKKISLCSGDSSEDEKCRPSLLQTIYTVCPFCKGNLCC